MSTTDVKLFLSFLVVSTTSLLPFNLYMNAHEYFFYKLRNVTTGGENSTIPFEDDFRLADEDHNHSYLQHIFEGWIALSSGIFTLVGSLLNVLFTNRMSNGFRVIFGHFAVFFTLFPTLVLTYANTDTYQHQFFWISMILASLASFGSMGLIGGGILGLAATFPEIYMQSVMFGQAFAGVLSSVLSILCQMFASDDIINGRVYFAIATGWTIVSVLAYIYLVNSRMAGEVLLRSSAMDRHHLLDEEWDTEDEQLNENIESLRPIEPRKISNAWREVVQLSGRELLSGFSVLLITLSVFPAVASLVVSESHNDMWQKYFSAVCCFLVFNIGDAIGRLLAQSVMLPSSVLVAATLSRALFIPLIVFCNVHPRSSTMTLITYDGTFIVFMILFSVSNGLLLTVSSVQAARNVPTDLKEVTGSIFALCVSASALAGSFFGVILVGFL